MKRAAFFVAFFVLVSGAFMEGYGQTASAVPVVQGLNYGYFSGTGPSSSQDWVIRNCTGGDAITSTMTDKATFITAIKNYYSTGTNAACTPNAASVNRNRVGAGFVIQTMRGVVSNSGSANLPTAAEVADWEARINQASVTISWNTNYAFSVNSAYIGWSAAAGGTTVGPTASDDVYYSDSGITDALVFSQGGSVVYSLKHNCGNPLGSLPGIAQLPTWSLTGTSSVVGQAGPGQTVTFNHSVRNNGPDGMNTTLYERAQWGPSSNVAGYTSGVYGSNCDLVGGIANGITRTCNKSFTIPAGATNGQRFCQRLAFMPATRGAAVYSFSAEACVTVSVVTCTIVAAPVGPEPGEPFTVTYSISGTPIINATTRFVGATTPPSGAVLTTTDLTSPYTITRNIVNPVAGVYAHTGTFTNGNGDIRTCSTNTNVTAKPYVHVYNGDASGTATFTCGIPSAGSLRAYNKGSAGGYAGSGAQVATLAASVIDGFTSASMRTVSPLKPTGLAFANTSGAYGGNFAQTPCVSDFWATAPSLPALGYSVNGTVSSGHYSSPGGGTTVANPGTSYVLYANGDVYLNGDTKFAGGGSSWNANNLPYFWLIVKGGNIYIKNSVAQLDGVYVSIPNGGAGGKIYTCSVDNGAGGLRAPTAAEMSTGCGTQLRINGAFIANQVKLLRTANTLRMSAPGEAAGASKAAEVFTFSPEIWLRSPLTSTSTGDGAYDAYSTLPPVL